MIIKLEKMNLNQEKRLKKVLTIIGWIIIAFAIIVLILFIRMSLLEFR